MVPPSVTVDVSSNSKQYARNTGVAEIIPENNYKHGTIKIVPTKKWPHVPFYFILLNKKQKKIYNVEKMHVNFYE